MRLKLLFSSVMVAALAFGSLQPARAQTVPAVEIDGLALDAPVAVDASLATASGPVEIVVELSDPPLAIAGSGTSRARQRAIVRELQGKQASLLTQLKSLGATEIARVTKALNAVIVRIDAASIPQVEALAGIRSIQPVGEYQLDLSETVPYIGASAVQAAGFDGSGVTVAVLDSGVDYTHRNLGGAGTIAAYQAVYGTGPSSAANKVIEAGSFPTAKVVGGYDFVGEAWPSGPLAPDPDPIDLEGHGTHVADIIGGLGGVAPGSGIYAVKVCSAVSSSCSGVAILQGLDYALDPNFDGDMADRIDIVNMSLGASYGQKENPTVRASANVVAAGTVVVASAGNSADRPYITGSPSMTPEVIAVAQTQVPSAATFPLVINSPAAIAGVYANTETLPWAPVGAGFSGDVVFGGLGCNTTPFQVSLAGKVALLDRGTCNISEKVKNASDAGAIGVLIGLVAAGDAVSFSNGGQCPAVPDGTCKPSLVIIQSTATAIKGRLNAGSAVNVSVSSAVTTPLVGSMVGSSSRGPSHSFNTIKPDIGAPGASLSAIAGTGTGEEPFGGTSGAAPMVAGAAALLLEAFPTRGPAEIKSLLMNTGETSIQINPATQPGVLAPITRIGGGEVRVDRALGSSTAAWDAQALTGSLSFGYHAITADQTFKRTVRVRNYSGSARTYTITPEFRYANDAASGAVEVKAPASITVPANGSATFDVQLKVRAAKLPTWTLNGGAQGGNGALLQTVEFDGYLRLSGGGDNVHLAWQIMPRKAAAVAASATSVPAGGSFTLSNSGAQVGRVDAFSLLGVSPKIQKALLADTGDGFAVVDLKSFGARLVSIGGGQFGIQFAINTFGERAHPAYPAGFEVQIDRDLNGTPDFAVYHSELSGFNTTGQTVVNVFNFATGTAQAVFFADADLNSGNMIMTAPLAAMGLTPSSKVGITVLAYDNYFTGNVTDAIAGITYTPGAPKYIASGIPVAGVPVGGSATVGVSAVAGGDVASPSQTGILLMYRDGKPKAEAETITVTP